MRGVGDSCGLCPLFGPAVTLSPSGTTASDHLDLNHCLWLSETASLDRRAGRTGYPEVAHAHVGALGECLVVCDEGVGLNNIGPSRASGLEAGVEVLKGLFELRPHVARADDVALCVACQLAGDVDGLTRPCDRDDM